MRHAQGSWCIAWLSSLCQKITPGVGAHHPLPAPPHQQAVHLALPACRRMLSNWKPVSFCLVPPIATITLAAVFQYNNARSSFSLSILSCMGCSCMRRPKVVGGGVLLRRELSRGSMGLHNGRMNVVAAVALPALFIASPLPPASRLSACRQCTFDECILWESNITFAISRDTPEACCASCTDAGQPEWTFIGLNRACYCVQAGG